MDFQTLQAYPKRKVRTVAAKIPTNNGERKSLEEIRLKGHISHKAAGSTVQDPPCPLLELCRYIYIHHLYKNYIHRKI